jgi:hypothetical protein
MRPPRTDAFTEKTVVRSLYSVPRLPGRHLADVSLAVSFGGLKELQEAGPFREDSK